MKNTTLIAFLALTVGFGAGWFLKPEIAAVAEVEEKAVKVATRSELREADFSEGASKMTGRTKLKTRLFTANGEDQGEESDGKMGDRLATAMKEKNNTKFDKRLAKLLSELNLSPAQEAELRAVWEQHSDGLAGIFSGKTPDAESMAIISKLLKGGDIDSFLETKLTEEQQEAYAALNKREFDQKVESRALKGLSKLSFLGLRDEQKDAVMQVLYDQAEESEKKGSETDDMVGMFTSGMGVEIDTDSFGFASILEEANSTDQATDPQGIKERMKEVQQKRIDAKVGAFSDILDESQLAEYRSSLEEKSQNPFNSIFLDGDIHSSATIEVQPSFNLSEPAPAEGE